MIDVSKAIATILHDNSLGVYSDNMNTGDILLNTSLNYSPATSQYYTKDLYISIFDDGASKIFDKSFGDIRHNSINIQVVGKTSKDVLNKINTLRLFLHCRDFKISENNKKYLIRLKITHVGGYFLEPESGWFQSSLNMQCGVWGS